MSTANLAKLFQNQTEVPKPLECKVIKGAIPTWLSGTMLRNGPGQFKVGNDEFKHWFDGHAYVQRYHFKDGKMLYSAKFLDTEVRRSDLKANRIVCSSFGTFRHPDPCKSLYQRFFSWFSLERLDPMDNTNVAFATVGDAVYALTETNKLVRIDIDTLQNLETVDINKYLTLNTYTAHQHSDPEGNLFNIGTKFGNDSHYVFARTLNPKNSKGISPTSMEKTELIGTVPCTSFKAPGYYHSFAITDNYFVLFETPLRLSITKLLFRNQLSLAFRDTMYWQDDLGTNVFIVNRKTGKRHDIKVTAPSFFTFHHANAFERDGALVVDYCAMRRAGDFDNLLIDHIRKGYFTMKEEEQPYLHRMIIPLSVPSGAKTGDNLLVHHRQADGCTAILQADGSIHCTDSRLCGHSMEFPRYNYEEHNMKPYRYVYGSAILGSKTNLNGLIKADVEKRTSVVWKKDHAEQICAEPIFVATPNATEEDDGVLIAPIMTVNEGDSPLVLILSAKDLSEVARIQVPVKLLPPGFHQHFVPRN